MKPDEIRELIKIVEASSIDELEVSRWGQKVRIRKSIPVENEAPRKSQGRNNLPVVSSLNEVTVDMPLAEKKEETDHSKYHEIKSPMVGTFYRAPSPDAEPYVKEGDRVKVGQVLCIIEAMKLMNEIEADKSGTIVKILIENAQPVEYNQTLFLIDPGV